MYDPEAVKPMWEELNQVGIQSITSADEIEQVLSKKEGTTLLVINSVCGCSAGNARPGVMSALQHTTIPDRLVTVFAGVDAEATTKAREYIPNIAPSSPFFALFKDGKVVFVLERRHIEMMDRNQVEQALVQAFDQFCSAKGPSISPEMYARINPVQQCGSSIPLLEA
jgi:putative YphP/YqiW family bacilliredoxin